MDLFEFDGMEEAEGIDFVPLWFDENLPPPIISSYTREEFKKQNFYPKTNRLYWKMIDGKKTYIMKD